MKRLLAVLLICAAPAMAQRPFVARTYAVGDLPSCTAYTDGWAYVVTDAATPGDCSTGSGSVLGWCVCDGGNTTWLGVPSLDSNGRLGIGTSSPGYELHVATGAGDASVASRLTCVDANCLALQSFENDAQTWGIGTNAADSFQIRDNTGAKNVFVLEAGAATNSLYIDSAGEVGIGTASPGAKLEVNNVLMITPQATAPATCSIGMMYVDTSGAYCACTSTDTWENMTGTGTCA